MIIDNIYKNIIRNLFDNGTMRDTRSGKCLSCFDYNFKIDLQKEFPLLTLKKVFLKPTIGELLFFLTAKLKRRIDLGYLRQCTFGENDGKKWTIWSDDQARWYSKLTDSEKEMFLREDTLGELPYCNALFYIPVICEKIKNNPNDRRLIIDYMPNNILYDVKKELYPLPPCHYSVQFYVENNRLCCKYIMRSNDIFLGFPQNIAFYSLLTYFVASCTGYDVGTISASLGDYHLYENQLDGAREVLNRVSLKDNGISLKVSDIPFKHIKDLYNKDFTALDFLPLFKDYKSHEAIKVKLCVGN